MVELMGLYKINWQDPSFFLLDMIQMSYKSS
jgi:hypothetical protein